MKLMVFNTQHCLNYREQRIDFPLMADTVKSFDPDIVGLNEMYDEGPDPRFGPQVRILSELTGMPHCYFAEAITINGENPYGNGLLSKLPIRRAETVPVPDPNPRKGTGYYESRCLLKAELEGGVTVLVIHFGLNADEQENAVKTILENLKEEKCILMGDFNVTPEDPVLAPIRARMKDTAVAFDCPKMSWPSDAPTMKIDYIFVSPDIEVLSADIPALVASDHRPYVAEVELG